MVTKEQDKNLLDVAEELFGYSPCMHCKNYNSEKVDSNNCKAFPDGIPEEIFFGENLHEEPYPGDHGIMFDPIEKGMGLREKHEAAGKVKA